MDDKSYRGSFKGRGTGHTGPVKANAKLSHSHIQGQEATWATWGLEESSPRRLALALALAPDQSPAWGPWGVPPGPLQTHNHCRQQAELGIKEAHTAGPQCAAGGGGHETRDHLEDWFSLQAHLGHSPRLASAPSRSPAPSSGQCLAPHPPSAISRPQIQGPQQPATVEHMQEVIPPSCSGGPRATPHVRSNPSSPQVNTQMLLTV